METRDARPRIADLPLDLFGEVEAIAPAPAVSLVEPDIYCWRCQALLTVGLATCPQCAAQNEVVPIVTSAPPLHAEHASHHGTYAGRVAFAFAYMVGDIARWSLRLAGELGHHLLDVLLHGPHSRNRGR